MTKEMLITIGVAAVLCLIFCIIIPVLVKKGIINKSTAAKIANVVGSIPGLSKFEAILQVSKTAVEAAEQQAKSGQITKEERFEVAVEYVKTAIKAMGATIDEETIEVIKGAIESFVPTMPAFEAKATPVETTIIEEDNDVTPEQKAKLEAARDTIEEVLREDEETNLGAASVKTEAPAEAAVDEFEEIPVVASVSKAAKPAAVGPEVPKDTDDSYPG